MEALTKYALNSTLGTSKFKPLDEIIGGQKGLVASNNVFAYLKSDGADIIVPRRTIYDLFEFNWNGSFKLCVDLGLNTYIQHFLVYKNGEQINGLEFSPDNGVAESGVFSATVDAKKGDVISLFYDSNYDGRLSKIFIAADQRDLSAFDLLFEV